jgi:hypothetical protein
MMMRLVFINNKHTFASLGSGEKSCHVELTALHLLHQGANFPAAVVGEVVAVDPTGTLGFAVDSILDFFNLLIVISGDAEVCGDAIV